MNREILAVLLVFVLVSVGFVGSLVTADIVDDDEDEILISIRLVEGWNLVSSGIFALIPELVLDSSEIQPIDIVALYYLDGNQQEYFQVFPNDENTILGTGRGYEIIEQDVPATWIYSSKQGMLSFRTDDLVSLGERNVYAGWNLISITPSFMSRTIGEIKGSCDITKIAVWEEYNQDWSLITPNDLPDHPDAEGLEFEDLVLADSESDLGRGMAMQVVQDCNFGLSDGGPPPLPPNSLGCQDDDGGKVYDIKGRTEGLYIDPLTNQQREEILIDSCVGPPGAASGDIDYYVEAGFLTEEQGNNDDVLIEYYCVGNYIEIDGYECLDGCVNGACL